MNPTEDNSPSAAVILEAGKQIATLSGKQDWTINGMPVVMIPPGSELKELPHLLTAPARKKGTVFFQDLPSFTRFFNAHQTKQSIITADVDPTGGRGATFTGILNYHGLADKPDFGDFRGVYVSQLSVEWKRWMEKNKVTLDHGQFCEHLETNADMIIEPAGAALLELITALEGTVDVKFANALNLHNGKVKLNYEEDVKLTASSSNAVRPASLEVPNELTTGIAPFQFGDAYRMKNRLRYRVQNRTLVFAYEAVDSHKIIQDAVAGQCAKVKELTGVEPFYANAPTAA